MNNVVIVEDDSQMRGNLRRVLEKEGFRVREATNGHEGLQTVHSSKPDFILCDLSMPIMDGYEMLRQIRGNPNTALIPFIILSSHSDRDAQRQGMLLGADDYLTKPFTPEDLLHAIHSRLNKQNAQEEDTRQQLLHQSHFVSAVTHDLRNPLAMLKLSVECLETGPEQLPRHEINRLMREMREQVTHMTRMLDEILTLGQIENGALPCNPVEVDAAALAQRLVNDALRLDNNKHPISVEAASPKIILHTDELLLRQALSNLLSNAIKYSPAKTPIVVLLKADSKKVEIHVIDSGIGIAADNLLNIFQPFSRGKNAGQRSGYGYGLYIVKSYVERLGGQITVQSKPKEGSAFCITLPLKS